MELILTGNMISAKKAEDWGLVNMVTDEEKLEEVTMELANQIAEKSPFATKRAKKKKVLSRKYINGKRFKGRTRVIC